MKRPLVALLLGGSLLAGCVPPTLFYWGDYSSTLYEYKKNPDDKTLKAHMQQLGLIITQAPQKKLLVPPGVRAEYGYLLLKAGNETEGMQYLEQEVLAFPESAPFIQRLKDEYGRQPK
jgi:hypothetical protein